jgi:chemotaxis protein CheX
LFAKEVAVDRGANGSEGLLNSDEVQPIAPELREQVLGMFVEAVRVTMQEMVNTEVIERASYRKKSPTTLVELSAVIGMESATGGALVLGCTEATAAALAHRLLAGTVEEPEPELIRDCLGEVLNVIAGQSKTMLFGTPWHFLLTMPMIVAGVGQPIPRSAGTSCLVAEFGSDVGEVVVQVCLRV